MRYNASKITHASVGATRREFCVASALLPFSFLLSCRSTHFDDPSVAATIETFNRVSHREPGLPGVHSLRTINEQLASGLSRDDIAILTGALYLEATNLLRTESPATRLDQEAAATTSTAYGLARQITNAQMRTALSLPIDTSPYGRQYLDKTIRNAKARLATDAGYRAALSQAQNSAARITCFGSETGESLSWWICGLIIVILIIVIL
jgi:hypothetical protein